MDTGFVQKAWNLGLELRKHQLFATQGKLFNVDTHANVY